MRKLRIGLAVSGGADSVALLEIMSGLRREFGFTAEILHVDHGLRPDASDDAAYVRTLAKRHRMPFHLLTTHVRRRKGESLEMAARRVRLAFFARMTRERHLDAIATGHHADDVAETFLMRLARGSGPDGLAGLKRISHVDGITFIRPLLDCRDADLRAYLRARGVAWREDSTNADTSILRNRVRHVILPFLREHLDARIVEHIVKSAAILRGDAVRHRVHGEEGDAVRHRVHGGEGDAVRHRVHGAKYALSVRETVGYARVRGAMGRFPAEAFLDARALRGRTLCVRTWRPGDRIAPTGMDGRHRKLQDVFVTAKVPLSVRQTLPILVDAATDEVLWVPGYRVAESVKVSGDDARSFHFYLTLREGRQATSVFCGESAKDDF